MAVLNVLAINCGSSSVKASFFSDDGNRVDFCYSDIQGDDTSSFERVIKQLLTDLGSNVPDVVGHRFVHGGSILDSARLVDHVEHKRLTSIISLAPLHLPNNLLALELCSTYFKVPQIACFDTSFHYTMPALSKRLPIPESLSIQRFGFHGLNYAHIAQVLPSIIGEIATKKIVVAHLGSGASLCLMENLQSVDTTMGYTPAGGIPMGTRSGDLDPGIMMELAERYPLQQIRDLVFHQMGLLALSNGESADMRSLIASNSNHAKFAIDYFCRQVRGAIGALASKAGGIDALVFSAGIGQHSAVVREKICAPLDFLGITLDLAANQSTATRIERQGEKPIVIIPADEEMEIARIVKQVCLG